MSVIPEQLDINRVFAPICISNSAGKLEFEGMFWVPPLKQLDSFQRADRHPGAVHLPLLCTAVVLNTVPFPAGIWPAPAFPLSWGLGVCGLATERETQA